MGSGASKNKNKPRGGRGNKSGAAEHNLNAASSSSQAAVDAAVRQEEDDAVYTVDNAELEKRCKEIADLTAGWHVAKEGWQDHTKVIGTALDGVATYLPSILASGVRVFAKVLLTHAAFRAYRQELDKLMNTLLRIILPAMIEVNKRNVNDMQQAATRINAHLDKCLTVLGKYSKMTAAKLGAQVAIGLTDDIKELEDELASLLGEYVFTQIALAPPLSAAKFEEYKANSMAALSEMLRLLNKERGICNVQLDADAGSGHVLTGLMDGDIPVALKELSGRSGEMELLRDLTIAMPMTNIVKCYGTWTDPATKKEYMVLEKLEMTLSAAIKDGLALHQKVRIAHDIAFALVACASNRRVIVHGDLKPMNVMLTQERVATLIDFDMGCTQRTGQYHPQPVSQKAANGGTLPYIAPELLRGGKKSTASDVYAYGVLLFQLFRKDVNSEPYGDLPSRQIAELVPSGHRPASSVDELVQTHRVPNVIAAVIVRCWDGDCARRPLPYHLRALFFEHSQDVLDLRECDWPGWLRPPPRRRPRSATAILV